VAVSAMAKRCAVACLGVNRGLRCRGQLPILPALPTSSAKTAPIGIDPPVGVSIIRPNLSVGSRRGMLRAGNPVRGERAPRMGDFSSRPANEIGCDGSIFFDTAREMSAFALVLREEDALSRS
jgi:hypothetical protein